MDGRDDRSPHGELLHRAADLAVGYLDGLAERPVGPSVDSHQLRGVLGGPQPETGEDALSLLDTLASRVAPGLTATNGPRFFGLDAGGTHPVAVAADWLTSAWDQNLNQYLLAPAAAVMEEVAGDWLIELFGLAKAAEPATVSSVFTAGGTAAHHTALAAARHALLAAQGWDVERDGLYRAPELHVVVGADAHVTLGLALQYLGLGRERVHTVAADEHGRMRPDALVQVLTQCAGPTIVCAQAANSSTGAPDPLGQISEAARAHGAWLHIDGGFGLWAAASPALRHLVSGIERADSWTTDVHKWLNVPYDSGLALCAHPTALRTALATTAPYLARSGEADQGFFEWVPEFSRRARGVPAYAVLRALGSRGVAEMVERNCRLARRMADALRADPAVAVVNDVVLNHVLLRCVPDGVSDDVADAVTRAVIAAVQGEGTCWLGGTTWRGRAVIRLSVSNWSTTEADVDRSVAAILAAVRRLGAAPPEVVVPLRTADGGSAGASAPE